MTTTMGRYRYWGDQKPDASRPLITVTRPGQASEAVGAKRVEAEADDAGNALSGSVGTLRIYGPIDSWGGFWGVSAKEVALALDMLGDIEKIVVRVNSPGGESAEGRSIMNLLRAHNAEVTTVVDGGAYSAASYIALAGNDRVMSPGTTFMIHDTSTILYGNAEAFRKEASTLDILSGSGAELYAEIAGGTVEHWRDQQRAETWYTAATAVEAGLMSRVGVVPDSGPAQTASTEEPDEVDTDAISERAKATYDLSLFNRAPQELAPKPPSASAVGSHPTEGGTAVALSPEQITMRQKLGIAEDADEATTLAALTEALDERADTDAVPTTTKVPEGMALVETSVLNELRTGAQAGREARQQQRTEDRDRAINDAIKAGKTTPARREHWAKSWDADPEGTKSLLDSLEAGLVVPTEAAGHAGSELTDTALQVEDDALEAFAAGLGLTKEAFRA